MAEAGGTQVDRRARRQGQEVPVARRRQEHRQQVLQQGGGAVGAQVHPARQVRRLWWWQSNAHWEARQDDLSVRSVY